MNSEKRDIRRERAANCSKGIVDALVDVGNYLEAIYGDDNKLADGGMESLNDYIDDKLGGSADDISIPRSQEKYLKQNGRVTGYMNTLIILRSLANIQGW